MIKVSYFLVCCIFLVQAVPALATPPDTFPKAKEIGREQVYHDRNTQGDLYCGCTWRWAGKSGGVMDLASCGYKVRAQPERAARIEWEHIVPASTFGRQRQCWQRGGRDHCNDTDPVFNVMEADLHNLSPVVGEVNADRANFNVGMSTVPQGQYGQCPFKVDFQSRVAEPPDSAKGLVARVHFYMADRYGLNLSQQQERLLIGWDRAFRPSIWEIERDRRIAGVMGHGNPFVSGQKQWTPGYRPARSGLQSPVPPAPPRAQTTRSLPGYSLPAVIGNKNSKIYHVRGLCPGYESTAPQNRVPFKGEAEAAAAGYRRAGNCR